MFKKILTILALAVASLLPAQQPQTNNLPPTQPIFATNAKYTNGVAPGYWPTANSTGLVLNISSGTANCSGIVTYAGGTLTMTNNTTNYVYLDANNSCVPSVSTSVFTSSQIPLAQVVTSGGNITVITDVRTMFFPENANINITGNLMLQVVPPVAGQFVVVYPTSGTQGGVYTCSGGSPAGSALIAATAPFSGSVTRVNSNPTNCPTPIIDNWNGSSIGGINPANVTAVYGGFVSTMQCAINTANNCGFVNQIVSGTNVNPGTHSWGVTTSTTVLCSGTCGSFNYSAVTWSAENDSTLTWIGNPPYGGSGTFQPILIVYYTGTPVSNPNDITVQPCLNYNQSTLSILLPCNTAFDSGSSTAYVASNLNFTGPLQPGTTIDLYPLNTSTTTTPTFNFNGNSALPIVLANGSALSVGDINLHNIATLKYDLDNKWHLQNPMVSGGGGSVTFATLAGGTNTTATMVVGTGASIAPTGSGTIQATDILGTIQAGSNVTITGSGTTVAPYIISSTAGSTGVSQIVAGTNINISPTGGTGVVTINSTASGGSNGIPSNAVIICTGTSACDDDTHASTGVLGAPIALASWTTTTGVTTFVTSAAHGLTVGQWFSTRGATSWPVNSGPYAIGTGYSLYQVASVPNSTTVTANTSLVTIANCSSSCGSINSAMGYLPFMISSQPSVPSAVLNHTYMFLSQDVTIRGLDTNFNTMFASSGTQVTCPVSVPTYIVVNSFTNDILGAGLNETQIQGYYQGFFQKAHACNMIVVINTAPSVNIDQSFIGPSYNTFLFVNDWLRGQGKNPGSGTTFTNGQYWDYIVDAQGVFNDLYQANLFNQSTGGLNPGGIDVLAQHTVNCLVGGSCPILASNEARFGNIADGESTAANGLIWYPSKAGNICMQWADPTLTIRQAWFQCSTSSNGGGFNVNGYETIFGLQTFGNGQSVLGIENPGNNTGKHQVNQVTLSLDTPSPTIFPDQMNNLNILRIGLGWQQPGVFLGYDYESSSNGALDSFFLSFFGTEDIMRANSNGACFWVISVNNSGSSNQGCPSTSPFSVGTAANYQISAQGVPISAGTQTVSGCSLTSALGGAVRGSFLAGTTSCTVTITPGNTASHGFSCWSYDLTTPADNIKQTAYTTTTATISGTVVSGDLVTWGCDAF